MVTIGDRLALLRSMVGLSARELDRLAGAAEGHASAVEREEFSPKRNTIARWAVALGVPQIWLEYGKGRVPGVRRVARAVAAKRVAVGAHPTAPRAQRKRRMRSAPSV